MLTPLQQSTQIFPIFAEMQRLGMPASRSYFERLHSELQQTKLDLVNQIGTDFNDDRNVNPNSSPQVAAVARRLGIELKHKTPTGRTSTSKGKIEHLRHSHDFFARLFDWREVEKQDSFCRQLLECTDDADDAPDIQNVVGDLLWTRTATRRLSMKKVGGRGPSLLTIPTRQRIGMIEGLASKIRRGFVAPDDMLLGGYDLSQIEMRIMAHLAYVLGGDDTMLQVFASGKDFHSMTASRMFNVPIDELDQHIHRIPAKTTGFGIGYGQGDDALQAQFLNMGLSYTRSECNKFRTSFYNTYPGVSIAKDKIAHDCKRDGYVRSLGGMYRYLPGIDLPSTCRDHKFVRAESERKAFSHVVQATAQEVMQSRMVKIHKRICDLFRGDDTLDTFNVSWRLQIHDEVLLTFDQELKDIISDIVIEGLSSKAGECDDWVGELLVDIKADGHVGRDWSELK